MQILGSAKKMLIYLGLGRDYHADIGGFKIPKPVIWLWLLFTQVYFAGMQVIVIIINHAGGLPAILFPAHCISLIIMKSTIYTVLVLKTQKMWELIDYLQDVVTIRELKLFFFLYFCINYEIKFVNLVQRLWPIRYRQSHLRRTQFTRSANRTIDFYRNVIFGKFFVSASVSLLVAHTGYWPSIAGILVCST